MKFRATPPVRRAVPLRYAIPDTSGTLRHYFDERHVTFFNSGTAALCVALERCRERYGIQNPEVLLPAYGCPDLIAACIRASVYPRLFDVMPSRWSFSAETLSRHITTSTIAVIAVNLLGIGDGAISLSEFCKRKGLALIQDSAQALPRIKAHWPGDYIVLSFGRGKPLNLLGGGALIDRLNSDTDVSDFVRRVRLLDCVRSSRIAAVAFNILTKPTPYWLLSALPGIGLGRVFYEPLKDTGQLSESRLKKLDSAFSEYLKQPSYRTSIWRPALQAWNSLGISPLFGDSTEVPPEALRLTLLAPTQAARDQIFNLLYRAHLGATRLYRDALPDIPGMPKLVSDQGPFPNATDLAHRLLTLPTHDLVTQSTVDSTRQIIDVWYRSVRI